MANDQSGASRLEPTPPTPRRTEPTQEPRLEAPREGRHVDPHTPPRQPVDQESVLDAQKQRYGGIKVGSAFFGWLTATGMALVLTALAAAAGAAVGVATNTNVGAATAQATNNAGTVGVVGAIVLLLIVLVAYYCGGYVAGRMARFDGAKQGLAVWLWALLIAGVLALVAAVAGSKYNVLGQLNAFPRIPVDEGTLSTTGIIALVAVAVAALAGAILGGLAGMRYHRKVDQTGLEEADRVTRPSAP
ncbi:MAG: hypothetical protein M3Y71_00725 [Actinomycetota bacterium]|nr:hypothetical protein [Actinomycetota bacterium]